MSILSKIKKRIKTSVTEFKTDSYFSFGHAFIRFLQPYLRKLRLHTIVDKISIKSQKFIFDYLQNEIKDILIQFKSDTAMGIKTENSPIWICWWTGEETAPALVKQCIKSIRNNANGHPVNFITKDNYSEYIDIPSYMLEKAESGKMKIAHLCDYIRVALLEKYGGLWLDTTIYCSQPIDEYYFSQPFFTAKSQYDENCGYVSKMRWVTFILGGYKNNVFYSFLKSAFEQYWKNNEYAIDYLFFDCLIDIAYNNIPEIKSQIDNLPVNNLHRDDLQAAMNEQQPAEKFNSIIKSDTVFYKLSWRETYSEFTNDNKATVYKYLLDL